MSHQHLRGINGGSRVPPPSVIPDRFGNILKTGDLVLFHPAHDLVFHVERIVPALDPNLPPGAVQLVLTCNVPLVLPSGQPFASVVRVGQAQPRTAETPVSETTDVPVDEVAPATSPEVLTPAETPDTKIDTVEPEA